MSLDALPVKGKKYLDVYVAMKTPELNLAIYDTAKEIYLSQLEVVKLLNFFLDVCPEDMRDKRYEDIKRVAYIYEPVKRST